MTTNYHSPWAMVKFGEVGVKLAFIESYDPEKGSFRGRCANKHWRKVLNLPVVTPSTFYKTSRKFTKDDVLYTWRFRPSLFKFILKLKHFKSLKP